MPATRPDATPADRTPVLSMLWPLLLAAYGVFRLVRHYPQGIAWLLLDGTLVLLGVVWAVLNLLAHFNTPEKGARDIDEMNRTMYCGEHERRVVDESTIRAYRLDVAFFRETTEQFRALKFRVFGDVVDVTAAKATPWARAVSRIFLSEDGVTTGAAYDVRLRSWPRLLQMIGVLPKDNRCVDLETELTDGTFVTTSTAESASQTLEFPGISRRFRPVGTPVAELYEVHRNHLKKVLSQKADAVPVVLRTFEEVCASQGRQEVLKSNFRNSGAFDPGKELERVGGESLNDAQEEMARELRRVHRERIKKQCEEGNQ